MEDVFRFMMIRPATEAESARAIRLEKPTELVTQLRGARAARDAAPAMRRIAAAFVAQGYVDAVDKLRLAAPLRALERALAADAVPADAIVGAFGMPASELIETDDFRRDREALWNAIIAIKLLPSEHTKPLRALVRALALLESIAQVASAGERPAAAAVREAVILPDGIFPVPVPAAVRAAAAPLAGDSGRALRDARAHATRVRLALEELMATDANALEEEIPQAPDRTHESAATRFSLFWGPEPRRAADATLRPPTGTSKAYRLKESALTRLSEPTRALLGELRIDPRADRLDVLADAVNSRLVAAAQAVASLEIATSVRNVARIGSALLPIGTLSLDTGTFSATTGEEPPVPLTHGEIRTAGVADLLIVKQQLKAYEQAEIAHIENILKGERKAREHRRTVSLTETLFTETETTKEEERELESTERFEMQREASETVKEDAKLESGLKITGKYGVAAEFEASAQGAVHGSRERSIRQASTYSREVTSRASSKITERFKRQLTRTTRQEVEETNRHELDNVSGQEHVIGVYQWINKVYEAQVFRYGLRAMFELVVPEPAALLIAALKRNFSEGSGLVRPVDFTATPSQITEDTYGSYVRQYEVVGVDPPPQLFVTVAKTFRAGPDSGEGETRGVHGDATELAIPDGYQADRAFVVLAGANWWDSADAWRIRLVVGNKRARFEHGESYFWEATLTGETTAVPIALKTFRVMNFALAVEVLCRRTSRARELWQLKTHATILQAYQQKKNQYDEKVAAFQAQVGVKIAGRDPLINRKLERDELKRSCISLFTQQHFDHFDAVDAGAGGMPQIDLAQAGPEGAYARFFEQAFEWENLVYVLYPYFWGRKSEWIERLSFEDADPLFEAFLKAGSARVVVPARPGFEAAIDHFQNTGDVWSGGELPDVTSDLYLPIVEEIRIQTGAPRGEVAQGEPWDVVLPTSLVRLRRTGALPTWRKDDDGAWVPVHESDEA